VSEARDEDTGVLGVIAGKSALQFEGQTVRAILDPNPEHRASLEHLSRHERRLASSLNTMLQV
jgi:hypothetical protein